MTSSLAAAKPAPREPSYLDLRRSEAAQTRLGDLDIVLARCGTSPEIVKARAAIKSLVGSVLAAMLAAES